MGYYKKGLCIYQSHDYVRSVGKMADGIIQPPAPSYYQIVEEINRRFVLELTEKYGNNPDKIRKMAIIADGQIRMAFLQSSGVILSTG